MYKGVILLLIGLWVWGGCERAGRVEVPAEVGRGMIPVDSLAAVVDWLAHQRTYEAETLWFHSIYRLIEEIASQKADTVVKMAATLTKRAEHSQYGVGKGIAHLGWARAHLIARKHDSVLTRLHHALLVFERAGRKDYIAMVYHAMGRNFHFQGKLSEALTFYEKAVSLREAVQDSVGLANSYNNIGLIHFGRGQNEEALKYYEKALQIYGRIGDKSGLATVHNNLGNLYTILGRYDDALNHYLRVGQIYEVLRDQHYLAVVYNNTGNIYSDQGRYNEALEYYQRAAQILETIDDPHELANVYDNIGSIYSDQGQYQAALKYFEEARQIRERLKELQGLARSYNNIGIIHVEAGQYAKALECYQKGIKVSENLGDLLTLATFYNNIGNLYEKQSLFDQALLCYEKARIIREKISDRRGLASVKYNLGNLYLSKGNYDLAREHFINSLSISAPLRLQDLLKFVYGGLAITDSALAERGDVSKWRSAFRYARLHMAYKDSVFNAERVRKQAQMESQYAYEKREVLLKAQQEKERALSLAEVRRRETQRNLSLLALGIAVVGLGVLGNMYRVIRRQKGLLQVQAEEIQQKNADLESYNAELKATNQALETSYRVIQNQAEALSEKNEEILDSIRYAQRIQAAVMPSEAKWRRLLPDSFVFYQPRDIVAGDFYWLEETERYVYLGIADATGHGVPGAFVSLICAHALSKAVREEGLRGPGAILERVRELVVEKLSEGGELVRDGMDIALLRLEKDCQGRIAFAGANRPLWIVDGRGELMEIKGTRQSIGYTEQVHAFHEVDIGPEVQRPFMVYGFTDGIVDQMGGPVGRKLMTKGLREFLTRLWPMPCADQLKALRQFFEIWRGERAQMDDVTIVGIRIA